MFLFLLFHRLFLLLPLFNFLFQFLFLRILSSSSYFPHSLPVYCILLLYYYSLIILLCLMSLAIGAVCFGDRVGAFGGNTDTARRLAGSISETLFCFRSCMFNIPWYQYMRTPMYRRFERAADNMRQ